MTTKSTPTKVKSNTVCVKSILEIHVWGATNVPEEQSQPKEDVS